MPAREGQRGVPRPCGLNFIDAIPGPEIGQNEASTALLVGSRLQIWAEDGPLKGMEEASVKAASGLEAVYRTDGPGIWRALIAFTGDTAVAEDAQSEAFAQALARGDALRDPTRWIWRVAFRVAAAELKDRRHRSAELLQEPEHAEGAAPRSIVEGDVGAFGERHGDLRHGASAMLARPDGAAGFVKRSKRRAALHGGGERAVVEVIELAADRYAMR